jgi:hypothetical protein
MKRHVFFLNGFLFLVFFSLKSQVDNNPGPKATKDPTVYKGVTDKACAVEVSFGSYGAGIDGKAYEKVIATIEQYKISHTAKGIGREGETRICLPLTELKTKKKKQFINTLKKIAKEGQLVSVSIR